MDVLDQADSVRTEADREIVLRHVAQMLPLLTDEERQQAVGSRDPGPLLQRLQLEPGGGAFLATWWRTQDPLPASVLNERVAEHLARVAYSVKNFAFSGGREGFDDRGKAYVQFGPPFTKLTIPVDLARATQVIRENGYTLPGAMVPTVNEFWTYRHVDELIYYLFVQEGGRYQDGSPEDLVPRELRIRAICLSTAAWAARCKRLSMVIAAVTPRGGSLVQAMMPLSARVAPGPNPTSGTNPRS